MKKLLILLLLAVISISACKKEDPVPECESQNYGELSITNLNNYTYDLYVNSTAYGTIKPKETKVVTHEPGNCTVKFIVEDGYWYIKTELHQCDFKKVVFEF
jgi:hypothetical protein